MTVDTKGMWVKFGGGVVYGRDESSAGRTSKQVNARLPSG